MLLLQINTVPLPLNRWLRRYRCTAGATRQVLVTRRRICTSWISVESLDRWSCWDGDGTLTSSRPYLSSFYPPISIFFLTITVEIYGLRTLFENHREKTREEEISLLKTIINFWNAESDEFPILKIGILGRIFEEELVEVEKKRRKTITKRKPVLGSQGWKKATSKKQILADAKANDAKL